MKEAVASILKANAKAIVAFVVTVLVAQFAKHGLNLSTDVQSSVQTILLAVVTSGVVWLVPNKQQQ